MPSTSTFEGLARAGFAARGVIYILIGYLALRLGQTEDAAGALTWISQGSGQILLFVVALGLFGYALWRLTEAAIDSEGHGDDAKGIVVRAGGVISGIAHLALCWLAVTLAMGGSGGGGDTAQDGASTALSLPAGSWLLMVAALLLLGTGGYQLVKAIKLGFLKHIDAAAAGKSWVKWVGRAGYLARGTVFVVMAALLWRAAAAADADAAGGMDRAIDAVPGDLQYLIAAGLLMFGIFSLVEARFRRISDPGFGNRVKRAVAR